MKTETYNSLSGIKFVHSVPETAEEYDALAKRIGACVESANANAVYLGSLSEFRDLFCAEVEKSTGVERKTKDTGRKRKLDDGTEEPVLVYAESEGEYIARVLAEKNVEISQFQPLADVFNVGGEHEIAFDPSEKERKAPSGPKKLAEKYVKAGTSIIEGGKLDRWQARHGEADASGVAWTPESIGRRIKELEDAAAKKAREEALLEFAA